MPGLGLVEGTAEVTGSGDGVLFLDATHLHAHVTGLDNHHHPQGLECLLDAVLDLLGHTLLNLQTVGIDINYTCDLRQAGNVTVGDIGYVSLAVEGQHVVFTE